MDPSFLAGSHSFAHSEARDLAYQEADVFLLCYKISDPTTLFSALNFWCPEVRAVSPSTPIVLVGCQADTRHARDAVSALRKAGRAPVSAEQALSMSQQIGAAVYVETCARAKAVSAFEVAALAAMGKLKSTLAGNSNLESSASPKAALVKKQRFSSVSPGDSLEREDRFWENHHRQHGGTTRLARTTSEHARKTGSLASSRSGGSLSCKTRSSISIPSISSSTSGSSSKTPKGSRRASNVSNGGGERMITIKCGRLNEDKTYEEIEVEVPAPIYDTIQLYNDASSASPASSGVVRGAKERRSLGSKLRNLFTSNKV